MRSRRINSAAPSADADRHTVLSMAYASLSCNDGDGDGDGDGENNVEEIRIETGEEIN